MIALKRRTLLASCMAGAGLSLIPGIALPAPESLCLFRVRSAGTPLRAGVEQALLVDSAHRTFDGAGLYLYPAWGSPQPYRVAAGRNGRLRFHHPVTGALLWEQGIDTQAPFAAAVVAELPADLADTAAFPVLQVPRLPA